MNSRASNARVRLSAWPSESLSTTMVRCSSAGPAVIRQPLHGLRRGRGAVRPRRGHHDQRIQVAQHLLGDRRVHRRAAVDDRDREMAVQPRARLPGRSPDRAPGAGRPPVHRPSTCSPRNCGRRRALTSAKDPRFLSAVVPRTSRWPRIDPAAQPAEGGVGVDRHDAVLPAEFGEDRSDAGGHRRLSDAALAQHADLVVAVQAADGRLGLASCCWRATGPG